MTGDLASADVNQRTVRMQRHPEGSLHKVDDIRDPVTLVDDAPVER